jgi:multisubunit Na+/H+ antiporter MnhE subunit
MRRLAAWLSWFAILLIVWLLLVAVVQDVEIIAGLCAAAIGATTMEVVRSQGLLSYRVETRWLARGARRLLHVVPEFFGVLGVIFRPQRGVFRILDFPTGGERAVDHGRRAWAGLAASLAPGRLVVDLNPETGEVLVHDLGVGPADELL